LDEHEHTTSAAAEMITRPRMNPRSDPIASLLAHRGADR
jgi:hypothetical protein